MASSSDIDQKIANIGNELKTLRLPHKLNQYRTYEKQLRKLCEEVANANIGESERESYREQLCQLQSLLDNCVICGVNQCFLCGDNSQQVQVSKFTIPNYRRSISANPTTNNLHRISKSSELRSSSSDLQQNAKTIPNSESNSNEVTHIKVNDNDNNTSNKLLDHSTNSIQQDCPTIAPSNNAGRKSSFESLKNNHAFSKEVSSINRVKTAPVVIHSGLGSPLRNTSNSYRAYKDFIKHYSTEQNNKTNQAGSN